MSEPIKLPPLSKEQLKQCFRDSHDIDSLIQAGARLAVEQATAELRAELAAMTAERDEARALAKRLATWMEERRVRTWYQRGSMLDASVQQALSLLPDVKEATK